jgi:dipeptidyl-peptidase III
MVANRNRPPDPTKPPEPKDCPLIDPSEVPAFLRHHYHAWNLQVTLHELFGHGTGKLLTQDSSGGCNFDPEDPPLNPLTGKPVSTWYKAGQTWTSVFGSLATSMEECRAECVGAYLITEKPLLALFGFDYNSEITPDEIIYSAYLQLGILGLRALESYIVEDQKWGQAHDRGHFARLQVLLGAGDNFMTLNSDFETKGITVHVDRSKIISHGKKALTEMLLKLHIYRCTADIHAGKEYFEALTAVDEKWLRIREIVLANQIPGKLFVQANTFLKDGVVEVKEYAPTVDGIIQSWAERDI